ncbi:MAG TPA: hypothetical protein VGF50_08420 [Caulobacteraceae bacterium]|jgi:hypothetical protein
MQRNGQIWWGAITSVTQAREIIAWAAWSLIVIGAAPVASLSVSVLQGEVRLTAPLWQNLGDNWYVIGQALFVVVVIFEAVLLLVTRAWIAALMLLMCCAFVFALVLATIFRLGSDVELTAVTIGPNLVLIASLMFFANLVWRAMNAAHALRRLQTVEHFS